MADRLAGKTALVTGATGSLGGAIARAFAAEGALVAGSGRDDNCTPGGKALALAYAKTYKMPLLVTRETD